MKNIRAVLIIVLVLCAEYSVVANKYIVNSQAEFNTALGFATTNDSIVWEPGLYSDIYMNISKSNLVVIAQVLGATKFTGASKVNISGDYVTLKGFQFIDGNIGTSFVINTTGSHNLFEDLNIAGYTSYKYLVINAQCQYNVVRYCNFENRINLDDQNILSVLVDSTTPGYHTIQYCSFKNFDGTGNDMGIEPIRIGVSTQKEFISRSIVEYCYFTQCNGDGEIISNKARQNVFRYNTFENNPLAELVLRHGDEGVVYGNFFLNGMGGVRVREGKNHVIFNNYFSGLTKRSIFLQNESSDPLDFINVAFNTFVNSAEIILGGSGSFKPTNVTFANNIFSKPANDELLTDPTNTEEWIGNIYFGDLGITKPAGITELDPKLTLNGNGFYGLTDDSPAIDAAQSGYPAMPQYPGLVIDNEILFDVMEQARPSDIPSKDIGCSEYPQNISIKPIATEANTGPSYFMGKVNLKILIEGQGSISLDPPNGIYDVGTNVTVTATPSIDFSFVKWSGDLTGNSNPKLLTMTSDKEVTAEFAPITALNNSVQEQQIRIFPNPVTQEINLTLQKQGSNWVQIEIVTSENKKVKTVVIEPLQSEKITLKHEVRDLPPGLYLLYILEGSGGATKQPIQVYKFLKQ